jgi:hypothetical protein
LDALSRCKTFAYVLAFSFDLSTVAGALIAARARRVDVRLLFDRTEALKNSVVLRPLVLYLIRGGVDVRLSGGRQHGNALLTERDCVFSSAEWTEAAQGNHEYGAVIQLFDTARESQKALYEEIWDSGRYWDATKDTRPPIKGIFPSP